MFQPFAPARALNHTNRELTGGTRMERISYESLTRVDSGFVHGYM
jgi:hypothetical protein